MRSWLLFVAAALLPIGLAVVSPSAAQEPARTCTPIALTDGYSASGSFCPAPPSLP